MDAKFPDNSYREEETDFEDLLQDNVLPDNSYRTLEQRRNRRKRIGSRGITACSDEEHSWAEDERKTFKGSTRVDVDKRLQYIINIIINCNYCCRWGNKDRNTSFRNIHTVRLWT